VRGKRRAIDRAVEGRTSNEGLELRAEGDQAGLAIHIQRLLAETIANEQQLPAINVPDSAGKHAHQVTKPLAHAPVIESSEHHLRVRPAPETESAPFELAPQFLEVVDLAIEHD